MTVREKKYGIIENKHGVKEKAITFYMDLEMWEEIQIIAKEKQLSYKNFINNALKVAINGEKENGRS